MNYGGEGGGLMSSLLVLPNLWTAPIMKVAVVLHLDTYKTRTNINRFGMLYLVGR